MARIKELLVYKIVRGVYYWLKNVFLKPFFDLNHKIKEITRDHIHERTLGINTVDNSHVKKDATMFKDSFPYEPTPYKVIEKMLSQLCLSADDVFVDLGCGKGRVIFSVATKRLKKVIGVETRKDIFDVAVSNAKNLKIKNTPVEVINSDVATFDMTGGTIFFMANPFGINTQKRVMENIRNSLKSKPRMVRVICCNGPDLDALINCDWLVREENFGDIGLTIWRSK